MLRRSAIRWLVRLIPLGGVVLVVSLPAIVRGGPLQRIWSEDFGAGRIQGWTCCTYHPTDLLRVVRSVEKEGKCNWVLEGKSFSHTGGRGYLASSPDLEALGIDFEKPYVVRFRYRVPRGQCHWTYALSERAVTLIVRDTDLVSNRADFGWLERDQTTFHRLAKLELGRWHSIVVNVSPRLSSDEADFSIYIDGIRADGGTTQIAPDLKRLRVMDVPYAAVGDDPAVEPIGGCGGGFWDDFDVRGERLPGPIPSIPRGRSKLDMTVVPNPANPMTEIRFELTKAKAVTVEIFAADGRRVSALWSGVRSAGPHALRWRGQDDAGRPVSSGVYFALVRTPEQSETIRFTLLQ
jgi:hypothetical protein